MGMTVFRRRRGGLKSLNWLWLLLLCLPLRSGASAPVGQYTVNLTDGTVTDNKTGLIWQRAYTAAGYFSDQFTYCATLSIGSGALTSGWRMPTVKELLTIVDETVSVGARIDANAFGPTPPETFWGNSVTVDGQYVHAYSKWVNFANGYIGGGRADMINWSPQGWCRVRCVHDP